MIANSRINDVLARAFDYDEAIKRHNRTEAEMDELRKLVIHEKTIPKCVTNKHVSLVKF